MDVGASHKNSGDSEQNLFSVTKGIRMPDRKSQIGKMGGRVSVTAAVEKSQGPQAP